MDVDEFVRRAEELVGKLAEGARACSEGNLDAEVWLKTCETTSLFYLRYHDNLARELYILLANPGGGLPPLLRFLQATDLERHFPAIDPTSADFGPLTATVKHATARVLAGLLGGRDPEIDVRDRADAALAALLRMRREFTKSGWEMLKADEMLLDLAFGRYEKIVRVFERVHRFHLAKLESAARTMIKECYLLSKIATGTADDDDRFGARSLVALLKHSYYLWRVNEHLPARIHFMPVVLASWLHERIANGRDPEVRDLFLSLRPGAVLAEIEALRGA